VELNGYVCYLKPPTGKRQGDGAEWLVRSSPHDLTMRLRDEADIIVEPVGGEWGCGWVGRVCRRGFLCLFGVRRVLHDVKELEREDAVELGALLVQCPQPARTLGLWCYLSTGVVEGAMRERDTTSASRTGDGCRT
jgi:hypothetical protein